MGQLLAMCYTGWPCYSVTKGNVGEVVPLLSKAPRRYIRGGVGSHSAFAFGMVMSSGVKEAASRALLDPPKRRLPFMGLRGIKFQKTELFLLHETLTFS
jgi:hypothetical protein